MRKIQQRRERERKRTGNSISNFNSYENIGENDYVYLQKSEKQYDSLTSLTFFTKIECFLSVFVFIFNQRKLI